MMNDELYLSVPTHLMIRTDSKPQIDLDDHNNVPTTTRATRLANEVQAAWFEPYNPFADPA
jgi:hypothetical protein